MNLVCENKQMKNDVHGNKNDSRKDTEKSYLVTLQ